MDQYEDNVFYHLLWKILINFNQRIDGLETTIYMIGYLKLTSSRSRQLGNYPPNDDPYSFLNMKSLVPSKYCGNKAFIMQVVDINLVEFHTYMAS